MMLLLFLLKEVTIVFIFCAWAKMMYKYNEKFWIFFLKSGWLGETNLIFHFPGETWKKVVVDGRNKNKNIVNFYKL